MRQATARLQGAASEAVTTLRALLKLEKRPNVQCRAALGILTTAVRVEELVLTFTGTGAHDQRNTQCPRGG
jgi:hypothetical protein